MAVFSWPSAFYRGTDSVLYGDVTTIPKMQILTMANCFIKRMYYIV